MSYLEGELLEDDETEAHLSSMCQKQGGAWHRTCSDWNCECECHSDD